LYAALEAASILAPHVPLQSMDSRRLRSPHDIESDGLVGVAPKATDFEIAEPGINQVAQRGERAVPNPENRAFAIPRLDRELVSLLAGFGRALCPRPDRFAVNGLA